MGTTTFEAMRTTQVAQIQGVTPVSQTNVPFLANLAEMDFREWAIEHPEASLRRFSIEDLFSYEPPSVSNTDVEFVEGAQEVVVAYPNDHRFGPGNNRDKRDVMREDYYAIDNVVGHRGYGNYTDGHAVLEETAHEEADNVTFLVLTYRFRFWRAV